jgi:hypothetical protein
MVCRHPAFLRVEGGPQGACGMWSIRSPALPVFLKKHQQAHRAPFVVFLKKQQLLKLLRRLWAAWYVAFSRHKTTDLPSKDDRFTVSKGRIYGYKTTDLPSKDDRFTV